MNAWQSLSAQSNSDTELAGYALGISAGLDWGSAQGGLKTVEYLKRKAPLFPDLKVGQETDNPSVKDHKSLVVVNLVEAMSCQPLCALFLSL